MKLTSRKTITSIKNTALSIWRGLQPRWRWSGWRGGGWCWWCWVGSTRSSSSSTSVPVALWIVEAGTNSNTSISLSLHTLQHILSQAVYSPLMVIMSQRQERALRWRAAVQSVIKVRLRIANLGLAIIVPVESIEVGLDNMITQVGGTGLAGCVAGKIRWTHVGWEETEDVVDSLLVVIHFAVEPCEIEGREVLVGPGVGGDLVAFAVHALAIVSRVMVRR